MCPTVLGRLETRVATLLPGAVLGGLLWALTGNEAYLVLVGVLLLMGTVLDIAFYPFVIKWQPPWLTFVLACGELALLYVLAQILEIPLPGWLAVVWYWVVWLLAVFTKIVVLPIVSLGWIENGGEFRATGWTIPAERQPLPTLAAAAAATPPPLAREFSAIGEIPAELRDVPAPSSVAPIPEELKRS